MAPVPLESHQAAMGAGGVPAQEGRGGGSISLALLIDFIVQRTYHEITVLAELLPRKTDMERKMEIYNFATGTRQLFVRLLALVKWASSASKVDKSAQIMAFLDKQSMLFVETADFLSKMSREALVHARLPNFHIPAAVEVLTTGGYSRLPLCIRDRIVPPSPITPQEKRQTLQHLNQVIQHRLVTSVLPSQMRNLKIENGRVTFHVENEFEVSLTMMGDNNNVPWRLLGIDILVEDKETGEGKALVHSLQVQYIHQLIQSRLVDNANPLNELYNCLHFFCQALQLEVLYSQTLRLCRDRLGDYIFIEEYTPGKCLVISYWKELTSHDPRSELGYRLIVQADPHSPCRPLQVAHTPSLAGPDSDAAARAIHSEQLSLERLLVHTIYVRTKARLRELKVELEQKMGGNIECVLQGTPAVLSVPILQPCLRAEQLLVTVDTHTGILLANIPQYEAPLVQDIQQTLNGDKSRFEVLVSELRYWITQRRCEKTLQHLPATPFERLPLLYNSGHPMYKVGRHRTFIRLHKHPNGLVVVEFREKASSPCEMEYYFYLAVVKPSSIEDDPRDDSVETSIPKAFLKVQTLIELDTFVCTHGPFTTVDSENLAERIVGKRKGSGKGESATKRHKNPAYFLTEVAHVVALCDERIPFATMAQDLAKARIAHGGLQVEASGASLAIPLLQMPPVDGVGQVATQSLQRALLSASLRIQGKGTRVWVTQLVFCRSPIPSSHPREQGLCRPVHFHYEVLTVENTSKTVELLLDDWSQIAHLYAIVLDFAGYFKMEKTNLSSIVSVKSYTFSRLILAYGPKKSANVTIWWSASQKMFKLSFGSPSAANPHGLVKQQLQMFLNQTRNLSHLSTLLHETYQPLLSLSRLPVSPQLGALQARPQIPVQTFVLLPQSPTHIRVTYHNLYCLDVHIAGDGVVNVRDGAYSLFDKSNVVEEFTPTQGLRAFLMQFVDENAVFRRRSQSEDDNPPSPVTMETESGAGGSGAGSGGIGVGAGAGGGAGGLRFHAPHTPGGGGGSNPHTPASPHGGGLAGPNYGSSPAASFNLPSPPSLAPTPTGINPSPSPMLPHPSPAGPSMVASSPSNPLHVPSPAGLLPTPSPNPGIVGHSPAGSGFMGGAPGHSGDSSSPFPVGSQGLASPAPSPWPASPSVPRPSPRAGQSPSVALHSPLMSLGLGSVGSVAFQTHHMSRVLPQRSWAGAIPTLLTYEAFDMLCTASTPPGNPAAVHSDTPGPPTCALERFLGCVYLKKQLQRIIQGDDNVVVLPSPEPGVIVFKVESLQCKVGIHPQHLQSLHYKVTPNPEYKDQWMPEELQAMEKYFDLRVVSHPYRPNNLLTFIRLLTTPMRVIKDFVQIMRLELTPALSPQQPPAWTIQWCLRVPPSSPPIIPVGMASLLIIHGKILFFLQLTQQPGANPPGSEPASVILPVIYDLQNNKTQLAERKDPGGGGSVGLAANVGQAFKRFSDFNSQMPECTIWPALRDLLAQLPGPPSSEQQQQQQQQQPQGQMMHPQMQPPMHPQQMQQQQQQQQPPPPPPPPPPPQMQGQMQGPMQGQIQGQYAPPGAMGMGQHGMMS